jgi:acetolactate synthase-1/2/3 large subunit
MGDNTVTKILGISGSLRRRARESGKCALINVWVDSEVFSPGTMHQTMYK